MNPILKELNQLDIIKLSKLIQFYNCSTVLELSKRLMTQKGTMGSDDYDIFGDKYWSKRIEPNFEHINNETNLNIFKMKELIATGKLNPYSQEFKPTKNSQQADKFIKEFKKNSKGKKVMYVPKISKK